MQFPYRHIHIMGASGAGTTTLGKALASHLGYDHFDSDDYFWAVKYTQQAVMPGRLGRLRADLEASAAWIESGSIVSWGNPLIPLFDLVIFLSIDNALRLQRLAARERERYGNRIDPDGDLYAEYQKFMAWADLYERPDVETRSRRKHEAWLRELSCPILRIEGDLTVEERVQRILRYGAHRTGG